MKQQATFQTRREFLRTSVLGGALTWTVPGFVHLTMQSLVEAADGKLVQPATGADAPILVVVQLAGGNDGLNTLVPFGNDLYYQARPSLGIKKKDVLAINDAFGFHTALGGFKSLYDEGRMAIVQGVGYPNPNRSHFRSMEIWHTASDAAKVENHGWLGRYFDCCCEGMDASAGVSLGKTAPQAFAAAIPKGVTLESADRYRYLGDEDFLREVSGANDLHMGDELNAGDSIEGLSGGSPRRQGSPLDFLERTSLDAQVSSERIRQIAKEKQNLVTYPTTRLGRDLSLVGRLIAGEMPTRVYYVSQGGYDTHTNQQGTHQRLLSELGDALKAFSDDLAAQGNLQRVLVMSFSEFGRRVKQNASGGTDHGAASLMFVMGDRVRPGLHGEMPSLDPEHLHRGDLRHRVDFRSVYATVLERHLGVPSRDVLRKPFPALDLLKAPAGRRARAT